MRLKEGQELRWAWRNWKKPLEWGGQRVGKRRAWLLKPYFICTRESINVPFGKVMAASPGRGSPRQSRSGACAAICWGWEKGKRYVLGKWYVQGQIALSLTGKFPASLAAPHCSPAGGHITGICHENSKKHISTALLLMLQFLHQRMKLLKHYKEMDLENVSHVLHFPVCGFLVVAE